MSVNFLACSRMNIITLLLTLTCSAVWGQRIDLGKETEKPITVTEDQLWKELKSYEGNFRILCPGEMEVKVDSMITGIGQLAYHTFYFQDDNTAENLLYMLSYCDYPEYTVHSDSTELHQEFFKATLESAVNSVNGVLLYSDDMDFRGYPGKVWRIDYLNGMAVIKTRAYLIGNRYYSLQTITLKERSLNTASDKFLDSFRLLE